MQARQRLPLCQRGSVLVIVMITLLFTTAALLAFMEKASVDLLRCGSDRRTMVLVPSAQSKSSLAEMVVAARPTTAVFPAGVDEEIVLCEASGIHPRSLAISLERVYPGISEAAGRLLTRVDIQWQPLV